MFRCVRKYGLVPLNFYHPGVILNGLQAVKDPARSCTTPAEVLSASRKMLRKLSMTTGRRISAEKGLRIT